MNSKYRQMLGDAAICFQEGRVLDARDILERALEIESQDWAGWATLGGYNWQVKNYEAAIKSIMTARSLTKDRQSQIKCDLLLADCKLETEKLEEAEKLLRALWLHDDQTAAAPRLVNLLRQKGLDFEANEVLNAALARNPNDADLLGEKAYASLAKAEFEEPWNAYRIHHFRLHGGHINTNFCPYWSGEYLNDKRCLVWINQGLGDQLIFSRYLALLDPIAAAVVVVCDARLITLFELIYPRILFLSESDQAGTRSKLMTDSFDFQMFGSDLPLAFKGSDHAGSAFSALDIDSAAAIAPGQIKKIGVCWRSGFRENPQSIDRWTLDEHALRTLGALENVVLGDLQHGDTERLAESEVRFKDSLYSEVENGPNGDIKEFMQFISGHDLVLSIDSSTAIFAAMLGQKTWVLAPQDAFWFLSANEKENWFPNVRIFRKPWNMSWRSFMEHSIIPELKAFLS